MFVTAAAAGDWPQFLGPNRNSTSDDKSILRSWPEQGPEVLWTVSVGRRYAGPVIKDGSFPIWAITQCPLVYGDLLIVASQAPEAGVVAYDKLTGEVKWKTPNLGNESYASPAIAKIDGKDHLVMVISSTNPIGNRGMPQTLGNVVGIDPALRSSSLLPPRNFFPMPAPTPKASRRVLEDPPISWNVNERKNLLWTVRVPKLGMNSPVVWGNRLFLTGADDASREVFCFATETGELLWRHEVTDIPGSPTGDQLPQVLDECGLAAPTAVTDGRFVAAIFGTGDLICLNMEGERVYITDLSGTVRILKMSDQFELLGSAELGEDVYATPAFVDGRIYVRGVTHLFCIAEQE